MTATLIQKRIHTSRSRIRAMRAAGINSTLPMRTAANGPSREATFLRIRRAARLSPHMISTSADVASSRRGSAWMRNWDSDAAVDPTESGTTGVAT